MRVTQHLVAEEPYYGVAVRTLVQMVVVASQEVAHTDTLPQSEIMLAGFNALKLLGVRHDMVRAAVMDLVETGEARWEDEK
jgi:hypothetical protein